MDTHHLPADRRYLDTHEWALRDDDLIRVGITAYAQDQLGDVVYVGEFQPGARLAAGDTAGVVESVKAASDIYAPVAGELVSFNDALLDQPDLINQSPYETWIYTLRPDDPSALDGLLDAEGYRASLG